MITLVTHHRPHLDDICGMWQFVRFVPGFADAEFDFISTDHRGNPKEDSADRLHIGVGRGPFDEHKGDLNDCATSLVFKHLVKTVSLTADLERALEKIVAWVMLEDTGKLATIDQRDFTVPIILKGEYDRSERDSRKVVELGFKILDALLPGQLNQVQLENVWSERTEFNSRFGRAVALVSNLSGVDSFAYRQGIPLVIQINSSNRYHGIRAEARSNIDLTSLYDRFKQLEPEVSWYLHHSKKMLLCGGDLSPETKPSSLLLEEIIELLK
ncbi:MAG: hypothetical protein V1738_00140 [Patescibacteria group bacterium]